MKSKILWTIFNVTWPAIIGVILGLWLNSLAK